MTAAGRALADPIDIGKVAEPPFVRLPDLKTVFERRARRLEALAPGNSLADYLAFVAAVVRAQANIMPRLPAGTLPGPGQIASNHKHRQPVIDRLTWPRDGSWRAALDGILHGMAHVAVPPPAQAALDTLAEIDAGALTALADRTLRGTHGADDAAVACFVEAGLQVYWTRMAALLDPMQVKPIDPPGACPVCGSLPVASVVHAEGALQGVRFLSCPLCSTEWHCVRIKCASCQSTKGIAYQQIEGQPSPVKAETCDECRSYTKILYREKDPDVEAIADDLATFGLDVLLGEAGWTRAAPNPFMAPAG